MNPNALIFFCIIALLASCSEKDDSPDTPEEKNVGPLVGLHIATSYDDETIYTEKDIFFAAYILDSNAEDNIHTRWDFNGDLEWDTDWNKERTHGTNTYQKGKTHSYVFKPHDTGKIVAKVEVRDELGLRNFDTVHILVHKLTGGFNNTAPTFNEAYPHWKSGSQIPYGVQMGWKFRDPERNKMTYEIQIYVKGETESVEHLTEIVDETVIVDLEPNMTYAWQVKATDEWGASTMSDMQEFTTCAIVKPCPDKPVVYDSEGNEYPTVEICGKCWMAKNMNSLEHDSGWLQRPIKYCRNDDSTNCEKQGGYYVALNNHWGPLITKSICPDGFHIPTSSEWDKVVSPRHQKHMKTGGKVGLNLDPMGHMLPGSSNPKYYGERGYYWMSPIVERNSRCVLFGLDRSQYHTDYSGMLAPIRCVAD